MRQIHVNEHGHVPMVALDRRQRDSLLLYSRALSIHPEPNTDDLWCLRAGSHVGTVVLPGLTVRVQPKLSIARLFVMLSAAVDLIRWNNSDTSVSASSSIEDIIALALLDMIDRSLAQGLLRGYVIRVEESFVARGRLDLAVTIGRRPATFVPLVQEPEFLDENIAENRIIASALSQLGKRVGSPKLRGRVLDCQRGFSNVTLITSGTPLPNVRRNRLNARWWDAIELSLLILQWCGLDLPTGVHTARSFVVDMNRVFERFVFCALAEDLRRAGHRLQPNKHGLYLDKGQEHALVPDLSLWSGDKCIFAGDCKYKMTADAGAYREDIYQCLAYAAATGLLQITLIYGATSHAARDIDVVNSGIKVLVRTLNLAAPEDQLRAQVRALANEMVQRE